MFVVKFVLNTFMPNEMPLALTEGPDDVHVNLTVR
jgi:hypothetical protein